ncbi:MAG: hypothetical protein HN597_20430 [Desulfobacula sp.]|nr:hypothetical protein [Desulfobacula sp.]
MEAAITEPQFDSEQFEKLKKKLYIYKGIEYTKEKAGDHVDKAKACLAEFNDCPSKQILCLIADYSIERKV